MSDLEYMMVGTIMVMLLVFFRSIHHTTNVVKKTQKRVGEYDAKMRKEAEEPKKED